MNAFFLLDAFFAYDNFWAGCEVKQVIKSVVKTKPVGVSHYNPLAILLMVIVPMLAM